MKKIRLKHDMFALVEDEDFDRLNKFAWHTLAFPSKGMVYAIRSAWINGKTKKVYMHREIVNCPKGMQVDHRNHNTLDNRRENLRICSHKENQQNRRMQRSSSQKFIGVQPSCKKFNARIWNEGKTVHLGTFKTEIEAAKAYDKRAIELRGEFAHLNFPTVYPPG